MRQSRLFVVFQPFGILGEPAFEHSFALIEHLQYPPKGGKGYDTEDDAQVNVFHIKGNAATEKAEKEKGPPAFCSEIVFTFDDQRMKQADNQERRQTDEYTREVHANYCL